MSERVQKGRTKVSKNTRTETHDDTRTKRERERGQAKRAELEREMDEIFDEIDQMLEDNDLHTQEAQQAFVTGFQQKGGQLRATRDTGLQSHTRACGQGRLRARLARQEC